MPAAIYIYGESVICLQLVRTQNKQALYTYTKMSKKGKKILNKHLTQCDNMAHITRNVFITETVEINIVHTMRNDDNYIWRNYICVECYIRTLTG